MISDVFTSLTFSAVQIPAYNISYIHLHKDFCFKRNSGNLLLEGHNESYTYITYHVVLLTGRDMRRIVCSRVILICLSLIYSQCAESSHSLSAGRKGRVCQV